MTRAPLSKMLRQNGHAVEYDPLNDASVAGNMLKERERPDTEACDTEEEDSFDRMCK